MSESASEQCDLCGDDLGDDGHYGVEVANEETGERAFADLCPTHYSRLQLYQAGDVDSVLLPEEKTDGGQDDE